MRVAYTGVVYAVQAPERQGMSPQEKLSELLLELGNTADRRTRVQLLDRALRTALALMDADAALILDPANRRGDRLVLHAGSDVIAALPPSAQGSEVSRRLKESLEPIFVADLSEDMAVGATDSCPGVEAGPVLFTSLRTRNPIASYLAVFRRRGRARFTGTDARMMQLLTAWLGNALETIRLASGAQRLAVKDDLTEVYNLKFLKSALKREVRRASRFAQELSVVLVHVDYGDGSENGNAGLKQDLVLKELASVLAQQMRSFDVLARRTEDSFMIVLPQTNRSGATEAAERLRGAVEKHTFESAGDANIAVSLGIASFPRDGSGMRDLVAAANRARNQVPARGKSRVVKLNPRVA